MSIPLVVCGDSFQINPQAAEILSNIQDQLSVVSIVGPSRSGKSLLLNLLLQSQNQFQVGSSVQSCTKGVYLSKKEVNGKNFLFLDFQGFGSLQRSSSSDSKLFSLAIILSSLLIYNSVGVIDESNLNKLIYAINMQTQLSNSQQQLGLYPELIWVLRDFLLELEDSQQNPITATQYMNSILQQENPKVRNPEAFIAARNTLVSAFPSRKCLAFPRPVINQKELRNLRGASLQDIRPEFVQQFLLLKESVFQAPGKSVKGRLVNGRQLLGFLQQFLSSLNSQEPAEVSTQWEVIVKKEYDQINEENKRALEELRIKLIQQFPIEQAVLISELGQVKIDAESALINCQLSEEDLVINFLQDFYFLYATQQAELIKTNYKQSKSFNQKVAQRIFWPVFENIQNGQFNTNHLKLQEQWVYALNNYQNLMRGPAKYQPIQVFAEKNPENPYTFYFPEIYHGIQKQIRSIKLQTDQTEEYYDHSVQQEKRNFKSIESSSDQKFFFNHRGGLNQQIRIIQEKYLRKLVQKVNLDQAESMIQQDQENKKSSLCNCIII